MNNIVCANNDDVCVYQTDSDIDCFATDELSELVAWVEAGCFDPSEDDLLNPVVMKMTPGSKIKKLIAHDGTTLDNVIILQCNKQV